MITVKQAMEDPELMIKYKEELKDIEIFKDPWYAIFRRHPYLYREFSDRFDETDGWDVSCALRDDPAMILDLKNHLHKMDRFDTYWLSTNCPNLSLCMKHIDNPDKIETAYYIGYPHELNNLNKEERRKMGKKIIEFLRGEKM